MATDGELLLRAILANPAEDTPRLVYADWLQEQGEPPCPRCVGPGRVAGDSPWLCPRCGGTRRDQSYRERAEDVRVQVELARLTPRPELLCHVTEHRGAPALPFEVTALVYPDQPGAADLKPGDVVDLRHRQRDDSEFMMIGARAMRVARDVTRPEQTDATFLVTGEACPQRERHKALHGRGRELFAAWCNREGSDHPGMPCTLAHYDEAGGGLCVYRRGFVEAVSCTAEEWVRHADAIRAAQPVTAVTLTSPLEVSVYADDFSVFKMTARTPEMRFARNDAGLVYAYLVDVPPARRDALRAAFAARDMPAAAGIVAALHWPGVTFQPPGEAP